MIHWVDPSTVEADLAAVFFSAIREGPSPYTETERMAWAPARPEGARFAARLAGQDVAVADGDGRITGFMTVRADGYIDMAFVRPENQRRGIFTALCEAVEDRAEAKAMPRLWTHASLSAEAAFRKSGFLVIQREAVVRNGIPLKRSEMEKRLR